MQKLVNARDMRIISCMPCVVKFFRDFQGCNGFCRPSKARPRRNEPALLPFVLEKVASALGESPEEVAKRTTETAEKCFGL